LIFLQSRLIAIVCEGGTRHNFDMFREIHINNVHNTGIRSAPAGV